MKARYLLINFTVREGERVHDHHCLHSTLAKNINFVAERYVSTFWGYGEREDDYWWFFGEIIAKLKSVVELSEHEYRLMANVQNGQRPPTKNVEIGNMLQNVGELRELMSDLDDKDQVCLEAIDLDTGDVQDLYPMYLDVIDGIKLDDGSIVREVRFCQMKQENWNPRKA